ncbi:hypothetical protein ACJX0J_025847 [Zea mays]
MRELQIAGLLHLHDHLITEDSTDLGTGLAGLEICVHLLNFSKPEMTAISITILMHADQYPKKQPIVQISPQTYQICILTYYFAASRLTTALETNHMKVQTRKSINLLIVILDPIQAFSFFKEIAD